MTQATSEYVRGYAIGLHDGQVQLAKGPLQEAATKALRWFEMANDGDMAMGSIRDAELIEAELRAALSAHCPERKMAPLVSSTDSHAQAVPDDQRASEDMTLAHNARKTAIEECASIADRYNDAAFIAQKIRDLALALSSTRSRTAED